MILNKGRFKLQIIINRFDNVTQQKVFTVVNIRYLVLRKLGSTPENMILECLRFKN